MFTIGNATVEKIYELTLSGFALNQLLPALDMEVDAKHPEWIPAGTVKDGCALLSVHSWLLRHDGLTILIDTGAGNGKRRPQQLALNDLRTPFLERLAAAGVKPEMVDVVLHTHVHSDHVGWNTTLRDGLWVPTFQKATHFCSRLEWQYGAALADGNEHAIAVARDQAALGTPVRVPVSGTFDDSMRPLERTGQMHFVDVCGDEVLPGIRMLSTPGHSIDHAAFEVSSGGELAIFGGDVMHHPVELYDLDLVSCFCEYPEATRSSRRVLLERAAQSNALFFSSHFPLTAAGRISASGDRFAWTFEDNTAQ